MKHANHLLRRRRSFLERLKNADRTNAEFFTHNAWGMYDAEING